MNPAECPAGRAAASVDGHVDRVGLIPPSLLPTCGVVIIHFLSDYELGQHSTRVAADMQSVLSFRSAKVVLFSTVRFVSKCGPASKSPLLLLLDRSIRRKSCPAISAPSAYGAKHFQLITIEKNRTGSTRFPTVWGALKQVFLSECQKVSLVGEMNMLTRNQKKKL